MQKISIQLHADDIIYKPEDIAELEEYPPDQREAMVAAIMKEIGDLCITLRLSTTRVGGDKIYFFRGYQGPGRLGTWEERGTGKKGGKGNMGRKGRPTKPRNK